MILLSLSFDGKIIYKALNSLVQLLLEDNVHDALIGCTNIFQSKGHLNVTIYSSGILKAMCFLSS